jgi:prepilin peptidase CpaA
MVQAAADALLVLFACTAAWWDATVDRIPNPLTVGGLAIALALRALLGFDHVMPGLGGFGIAFAIAVGLYALGAIGGGDVKFLAAVGAFLGSGEIMGALALIAVLGMVFALIVVSRRGLLLLLVLNTVDLIKAWLRLGRAGRVRKAATPLLTIPYGVPIALGTLIWWFANGVRV